MSACKKIAYGGCNPYIDIDNFAVTYITTTTSTSTVCSVWDKGYRYGFNTQEKDEEIAKGHYTAEYWEYDSRLGRRWNLDPVDQVWMSNYSVLGNCPILFVDTKGDVPTPNYLKRAINRASELTDQGYEVVIKLENDGTINLLLYNKIVTWTNVPMPKGCVGIHLKSNITYEPVGHEQIKKRWIDGFKDFVYKIDDFTKQMKGNAEFKYGVILTSKEGKTNEDASKLASGGISITVDWDEVSSINVIDRLKSQYKRPENIKEMNIENIENLIDKQDYLDKDDSNKGEVWKVEKSKVDINPFDGKKYRYDSITNKKAWIRYEKPIKTEKGKNEN